MSLNVDFIQKANEAVAKAKGFNGLFYRKNLD